MAKIIGWRSAAKYVGHGVSAMRLRRLAVDKHELPATQGPDGWEFDTANLDRLRDQLAAEVLAPPAGAVAGAIAGPPELVDELPSPAPRPATPVAPWLAQAAEAASHRTPAPERAERNLEPLGSGEPPFWLTQGIGPGSPGVAPGATSAMHDIDAAHAHAQQQAQQAHIAHLQQALAARDQTIASQAQQIDLATQAYARAQSSTLAQVIAIESLTAATYAGVIPPEAVSLVAAIRDAAHRALVQLQIPQLQQEQYALAIGRQAAHVVSQQLAAQMDRDDRRLRSRREERAQETERAERAEREEHERDRARLAAEHAALDDRYRAQQLQQARQHTEELGMMREMVAAVAARRERERGGGDKKN